MWYIKGCLPQQAGANTAPGSVKLLWILTGQPIPKSNLTTGVVLWQIQFQFILATHRPGACLALDHTKPLIIMGVHIHTKGKVTDPNVNFLVLCKCMWYIKGWLPQQAGANTVPRPCQVTLESNWSANTLIWLDHWGGTFDKSNFNFSWPPTDLGLVWPLTIQNHS